MRLCTKRCVALAYCVESLSPNPHPSRGTTTPPPAPFAAGGRPTKRLGAGGGGVDSGGVAIGCEPRFMGPFSISSQSGLISGKRSKIFFITSKLGLLRPDVICDIAARWMPIASANCDAVNPFWAITCIILSLSLIIHNCWFTHLPFASQNGYTKIYGNSIFRRI